MREDESLKTLYHRWSERHWPTVIQRGDVGLLRHWHNDGRFQALWYCC